MRRAIRLLLLATPLLLPALAGCGTTEIAKGDLLKVETRTLASKGEAFRLVRTAPGQVAIERVRMCPVQEKHVWQEVQVHHSSAAVQGASNVGCGIVRLGELSERIWSQKATNSNCGGTSYVERTPTGGTIEGAWKTVRTASCGPPVRVAGLGSVHIRFLRSGDERDYPIGPDGTVTFSKDDLVKQRLYFTILKDIEVETTFRGRTGRQKIDLE